MSNHIAALYEVDTGLPGSLPEGRIFPDLFHIDGLPITIEVGFKNSFAKQSMAAV